LGGAGVVVDAAAEPAVVTPSSNTQGNMVLAVIIDVLLAFPVPCPNE
jgi:hypothetical protein